MSKYAFSYNQRYAVYKAFNGICQWCKEPVDFRTFHVDHVLPEELLNDPKRHAEVLNTYGLDSTFNINEYANWIPSHSYCNLGKSDKVYQGLGIIKTILDSCAKNKELEQRIELRLEKEPQKAELLAKVQAAIDLSVINLNELQNFVLKTDIMDSEDEDLDKIRKSLEQKLEYQTDKMVQDIMNLVKNNTIEVIQSICDGLGKDWSRKWLIIVVPHKEDTKYAVRYGIKNSIDSSLGIIIVVNPALINNTLVIKFRVGDDIFDQLNLDVRSGIDWELFRKTLREHYKARLMAKLK